MKKISLLFFILLIYSISAQNGRVGINTTTPQATLEIAGEPSVTTAMDGVIPPKISGDLLNTKTYSTAQIGAIVYVTSGVTGTPTTQTLYVTAPGTYYFDGTRWIRYTPSAPYMSASVIAKSNGAGTTPLQQGDYYCPGVACGPGSNSILQWQYDSSSSYCFDDYGLFDSSSNSFIIKETGVYEIKTQLIFYGVDILSLGTNPYGGTIPVMLIVTHADGTVSSHLMGSQAATAFPLGTYRVGNFSVTMKLKSGDKVAPKLKWVYASTGLADAGYLAVALPTSESSGGAKVDSPATFQIFKK